MQINPYLTFRGDCAEAFRTYEKIFGGKIVMMMNHRETPAAAHVPAEWLDKVMHARLEIGDQVILGSDAPPQYQLQPQGFSVSIQLKDASEGKRIFDALSEKGTVKMAFDKTFWADGFGMCIDRFGTPWIVNAGDPTPA